MKHLFTILAALAIFCLLGSACAPGRRVVILTPDYQDELAMDGVEMPGLDGTWILDPTGEVWTFACDGKNGTTEDREACSEDIELTIDEKKALVVDLFVLGTDRAMVIKMGDESEGLEGMVMLPVKSMLLIRKARGGLVLEELDPGWFEEAIERDPRDIVIRTTRDKTILVGTMEDVYQFVLEHSEDAGAFRTYGFLRRPGGDFP